MRMPSRSADDGVVAIAHRPHPRPVASRDDVKPREQGLLDLQQQAGNSAVQRLVTGGLPLATGVQERLAPVLGQDLSAVRVHTDDRAARSADRLGATAFTVGKDISFAAGAYAPGTPAGDALLAHELAHVAQQDAATATATATDGAGPRAPGRTAGGPAGRRSTTPTAGREPSTASSDGALEHAADVTAAHTALSLFGRAREAVSHLAAAAGPKLRSGLRVQRCAKPTWSSAVGKATAERVEFQGSHPLTPHASDPRASTVWTPGAADHAVAYTKGASPTINARFRLGSALPSGPVPPVSVRVKEGGAVRATQTGITPAATMDVSGLALTGLTGSPEVRSSSYSLTWEASVDGTTWVPVTSTGVHPVHWTYGTPLQSPTTTLAVAKATRYANGQTGANDVATAVRSGIRRLDGLAYSPSDPINPDPLQIYADGVGICTDFGNVLVVLARSIGMNANSVMFWGGFESLGHPVWAALDTSMINLFDVRSPDPAFNPPTSPSGWAFNYHVVARIEGVLHDAALDRQDIEAKAVHGGKIVHLLELAGGALPAAKRRTTYSAQVPRLDHPVEVTIRDFGPQIPMSVFGDIIPLSIPPSAPSPVDVPVTWAIASGALPSGLTLDPATGEVKGKPRARGTFSITVRTSGAGLSATAPVTITVS